MPIPWDLLIQLIIKYGLPMAERIWQKATSGKDPTQADFDELNALETETPETHLAAIAKNLGLEMDSPKIVEIAKLIAAP